MTYATAAFFSFAFSIFAASIAIFLQNRFPETENAIFFVGLILGSASLIGIFIDPLWSYLQKIYSARFLFFLANFGLIFSVGIFLFSGVFSPLKMSFFTFLAAIFYGWSYDLYDVTILTTILKRGKSENYAQNLSQKKAAEAIGMIFGLFFSGFFLFFGSTIAQVFLLLTLISVFIFSKKHFDREEDEIEIEFSKNSTVDWKEIFLSLANPEKIKSILKNASEGLKNEILKISENLKKNLVKIPEKSVEAGKSLLEMARIELIELLANENEIVKKKAGEKKFHFADMWKQICKVFGEFFQIFKKGNGGFFLIWASIVVIFFSFWDTMAAVFQPVFLKKITADSQTLQFFSGGILAAFVLPVLIFQIPFSKLADKFGRKKFIFAGILFCGVSLLFFGFSEKPIIILIAGMSNSFGYSLSFAPAQALFVSEIEKLRLKNNPEKNNEISVNEKNSENSAALLRVGLNLGNIFGQFFGGLIFAFLGFSMGFFIFGIFLLIFAIFSALLFLFKK